MATLNLIPAAYTPIILAEKHSFNIVWAYFEDDGTTPLILTGVFKMTVIDRAGVEVAVYTIGSGLSMATNELTLHRSVVLNTLTPGSYKYDIRNDLAGDSSLHHRGKIIVEGVISQP